MEAMSKLMPRIKRYAVVIHRRNKSRFCIMSNDRTGVTAIDSIARGFNFSPNFEEFENRFEAYDVTALGMDYTCENINFKDDLRRRMGVVLVYDAFRRYKPGIIYGACNWVLASDINLESCVDVA